ncbi:hypothetical protein KQ247_08785 [Ruegeria pomeroyi]|jgi:hypothetical protein|uniref:hypothetical protein n=1 Tax=Ruegeria pomeroyi TaxID=89184 RepID=UPI000EBC219E|nr:hypothetical protein [Ruegeria pomeroyi]QWV10660.1 hypothetical protein KQ247_08785 [Ruegeria pomeroyi]HCE71079.1 hypothetical protein [Ruegeria sp.]
MASIAPCETPIKAPRLRLFGWISFLRQPKVSEHATLEAELIRLAETAPHLLADIGFLVDHRRSTSARTVWVSPGSGLIFEHPGSPAVRRAG